MIEVDDIIQDIDVIAVQAIVIASLIEPSTCIVCLIWLSLIQCKHLLTIEIVDAVLSQQRRIDITEKWQDSGYGNTETATLCNKTNKHK